jgi:hypothetical protein
MHLSPRVLVLLVVFYAGIVAFGGQDTVAGRVVVYDRPLTCLNGNAYRSIIVRVEDPKRVGSKFIRVEFSHPCDKVPEWLRAKSRIQNFHLIRESERDEELKEFLDLVDESSINHVAKGPSVAIWEHVPGAEREGLPFGQRLPCYRFKDLPPVPVV